MKSLFALLFAASLNNNELPKEATPAISVAEPATITITNAAPQKDPKATEILNAVSVNTKSKKTISLDFTFTLKNGDMKESQKGKLIIKGEKYWYNIFGAEKISDGKSTADVITEDKEVTIGLANFNDPDEFSPQEMFTIYEEGYKYRYMGQKTINGVVLDLIDLYPEGGNPQPYRSITLFVNSQTNEIKKIELFRKTSPKVFAVEVNKVEYDKVIADDTFKCECERWPADKGWDCDDTSDSK